MDFSKLESFLLRVPAIKEHIGKGVENDKFWVKFSIDISHPLAWNVVQEIGHVVNYLSLEERLPTVFYPVSPPPYLNGGPDLFLSWIIESQNDEFTPEDLAEWLEGRLPNPVDDETEWKMEEDEDE